MAKKDKKNNNGNRLNLDGLDIEGEKKDNKFLQTAITIVIILIWLGIFAILIKLDVGGFGSNVLAPVIKDIPVLNRILPDMPENNTGQDENYPYKSLADAITYIKELEVQLADEQKKIEELTKENDELRAEIERLEEFEKKQKELDELKEQFYEEIVFGEDAITYDNYMKYYEAINPEKAEELYQEAVERYTYDEAYKEQADAYARMDPDSAAAIFVEMSGDLDIVVSILQCMKAADRAEIIAAISDIDANYAGKITKLIVP